MASYGLKYLCEYRSKMRGRLLYRIEIEERDAVALTDATALRMRPYSDVFTLKWGSADDPEYTAVKGSSLTLKILCVDDMEYLSLFSVDPLKFRVTIYEYRTGASGSEQRLMLWRGFLSASSYKESFSHPPYVVTLSATDGFALLDSMLFLDASGAKFSGRVQLSTLLTRGMSALGIDLPVSEWVAIDGAGGAERTLSSLFVDQSRIYEIDEEISWKSVLELAVKPFLGQIFQAGGVIHVRRIESLVGTFRPTSFQTNEQLLGLDRPRILGLWKDRCDLRSSSELELCAPYRNVDVSVSNTRETDANRKYYDLELWGYTIFDPITTYLFEDRIVFGDDSAFFSRTMNLPTFYPASKADVEISISLYNLLTEYKIKAYAVVETSIDGVWKRWDNDQQTWRDRLGGLYPYVEIDAAQGPALSEYYEEKYVSPYTPASQLPVHDFKITVANIPSNSDGSPCKFGLSLAAVGTSDFDAGPNSHWIMVSNIDVKTSEGDEREDLFSKSIAVTGANVTDCSIDIPIRDGGYRLNMGNILTCPITNVRDEPIVSWLAPTERGDLLHIAGEGILRLRSAVSRQIAGELRCRRTVDLNSLFEDRKFTRAVYYLNSLELLAARQVYNVQLRELQSLDRTLPAGELTSVCTFDEPMELVCSLYGSLFFRTGTGPYGVAIYNTENGELLRLAYASDSLAIRKGLSSVVIQVGTTDLYAVDNLGSVLSHLDSGPSSVLNFATALYDGDRHSWVSCTADSATSKTDVTIFTHNKEIESKDSMAIVATELMLISNGYVLRRSDASTWWHNYELHSSEKIETSDYRAEAISDSLLVARVTGSGTIREYEIRRRSGQLFGADFKLSTVSVPGGTGMTPVAMCNCAIVAFHYMDATRSHIVGYYDARTRKSGSLRFESAVSVALAGDRIYILQGQELFGFRLADSAYTLALDWSNEDVSLTVPAAGGSDEFVEIITNGTPVVVSSDSRIGAVIRSSGNIWQVDLTVPVNTSSVSITYDPVVIGVREDDSVQRSIRITQEAARMRQFLFDGSKIFSADASERIKLTFTNNGQFWQAPSYIRMHFAAAESFRYAVDFNVVAAWFPLPSIDVLVGGVLRCESLDSGAVGQAEVPSTGDVVVMFEK